MEDKKKSESADGDNFVQAIKSGNEAAKKDAERRSALINRLEAKDGNSNNVVRAKVNDLYYKILSGRQQEPEKTPALALFTFEDGLYKDSKISRAKEYATIKNFIKRAHGIEIDIQNGEVCDCILHQKKVAPVYDGKTSRIRSCPSIHTDQCTSGTWRSIFNCLKEIDSFDNIPFVWYEANITKIYWKGTPEFNALKENVNRLLDTLLRTGYGFNGDQKKGYYRPLAQALRPMYKYLMDNCRVPESSFEQKNVVGGMSQRLPTTEEEVEFWTKFLIDLFSFPEYFKNKLPRYLTKNS